MVVGDKKFGVVLYVIVGALEHFCIFLPLRKLFHPPPLVPLYKLISTSYTLRSLTCLTEPSNNSNLYIGSGPLIEFKDKRQDIRFTKQISVAKISNLPSKFHVLLIF